MAGCRRCSGRWSCCASRRNQHEPWAASRRSQKDSCGQGGGAHGVVVLSLLRVPGIYLVLLPLLRPALWLRREGVRAGPKQPGDDLDDDARCATPCRSLPRCCMLALSSGGCWDPSADRAVAPEGRPPGADAAAAGLVRADLWAGHPRLCHHGAASDARRAAGCDWGGDVFHSRALPLRQAHGCHTRTRCGLVATRAGLLMLWSCRRRRYSRSSCPPPTSAQRWVSTTTAPDDLPRWLFTRTALCFRARRSSGVAVRDHRAAFRWVADRYHRPRRLGWGDHRRCFEWRCVRAAVQAARGGAADAGKRRGWRWWRGRQGQAELLVA